MNIGSMITYPPMDRSNAYGQHSSTCLCIDCIGEHLHYIENRWRASAGLMEAEQWKEEYNYWKGFKAGILFSEKTIKIFMQN